MIRDYNFEDKMQLVDIVKQEIGATHMTGGENPFYSTIGYEPMIIWIFWKK